MVSIERLRVLILARRDFLAEVGEPFAHVGIGQGVHDGGIELCDNLLRCALAHPERMPNRNMKPWHASLVHGGNVGCRREAHLVRDRIRLDRAGTHLRNGIGGLVDHDVDLAGDEILHRGPGATVGDKLEFRAGDALESRPR